MVNYGAVTMIVFAVFIIMLGGIDTNVSDTIMSKEGLLAFRMVGFFLVGFGLSRLEL